MVFAFTTELAAGPLQAVKERWQTFSNAASELQATTRAGSEAVERDHAGGYQRQRRFSVFSFWKDDGDGPLDALDQAANEEDPNDAEAPEEDVIRDRDQDDAMVQRGETTVAHYQRTVSDSKSQVDKPLPPAPAAAYVSSSGSSGPRLGNVSTALPVYERYPSQRSQKAQVEQVGGASGGLLGLVDMDQARNVVRQANEVYDGIDEAQEDVRKRLARTRNRQGPVRIDQLPGGGPLTRPVGHHVASSSSGSRMHEDGNHTTSSPPPQPPLQRSPPGTTYVPAPPAEHLGQSEYGMSVLLFFLSILVKLCFYYRRELFLGLSEISKCRLSYSGQTPWPYVPAYPHIGSPSYNRPTSLLWSRDVHAPAPSLYPFQPPCQHRRRALLPPRQLCRAHV